MKRFLVLCCFLVLTSPSFLRAQQTFVQGGARWQNSYPYGLEVFSTAVQTFRPTVAAIDYADVALYPPASGITEVRIRAGSHTGVVVAVSRDIRISLGVEGLSRVVFTNRVSVTPGALYGLELAVVQPPSDPLDGGHFVATVNSYPHGELILPGVFEAQDLYFQFGTFTPDILLGYPGTHIVRYEQYPGQLFERPEFTNEFVSDFDGATVRVTVSQLGPEGELGAGNVVSNQYFFGNVAVGTVESLPLEESVVITLNSNASASAVASFLSDVQFGDMSDMPLTDTRLVSILFSNALGYSITDAYLTVESINDEPVPRAAFPSSILIPPNATRLVIAPNRRGTEVFLDGTASSDVDGPEPLSYYWSSRQNPDSYATGAQASAHYRPGLYDVELVITDGGMARAVTHRLEVITALEATSRLKASVRAGLSDARLRLPLIRALQRARVALANGRSRAAVRQLEIFNVHLGSPAIDPNLAAQWNHISSEIQRILQP
jgi:hypothetical protein